MSNFARRFKKQASYEPPKEVKLLNALRTAAYALQQYAKGTSWAIESETGRVYWIGDGDGPSVAEDALGKSLIDKIAQYTGADVFASDDVIKDQWEFQMQCRVLEKVGVEGLIVASDGISVDELAECHVTPAEHCVGKGSAPEQLQKLIDQLADGPSTVALLPRGPYILPKVQGA